MSRSEVPFMASSPRIPIMVLRSVDLPVKGTAAKPSQHPAKGDKEALSAGQLSLEPAWRELGSVLGEIAAQLANEASDGTEQPHDPAGLVEPR